MSRGWWARVGLWLAMASVASGAEAQSDGESRMRPDVRSGVLGRVDVRVGWMVTAGEGYVDRPVLQVDGGAQLGRARPGGPPAVAFTAGAALGIGDFLAEETLFSMRLLAGLELPFALAGSRAAGSPLELVPALQAGYHRAFSEDERSGFTLRAALGLRVLPQHSTVYFTLEPIAFVYLSPPTSRTSTPASRRAVEIGLFKMGWRF